jgi:DNA (cytosine-5)-methyltransferase 3A
MKVLSLFDGISCGRVALERVGIPVERYVAFEIDRYAIQVSRNHYPDIEQMGDVRGADYRPYKGFDLVMGGFPCTDLSVAKAGRKGLAGEHSSLFWELVRAIREVQPHWFLVENNASMPAADRATITAALGVEPIMINSSLVSAQHRRRLYWTNIPNITQPQDKGILLLDVLEDGIPIGTHGNKAVTITAQYGKTGLSNTQRKGHYKATMVAEPICLNSQSGRKDGKAKQPSLQERIYSVAGKMPALTSGFRPYIAEPVRLKDYEKSKSQAQRVYSVHAKSITMYANGGGGGANTGLYKIDLPDGDYVIRKLTPVEVERLQTLPDNYTAGISNTQRYKCCGNGWTGDVIVHILKPIYYHLNVF